MPTIECGTASRCIPCVDEDPVLNLSAEQPDDPVFVTPFFTSGYCYGWCFSTLSQAAADLCAQEYQELYCQGDPPDNPLPPPGGSPGDDDIGTGDDGPGGADMIYWNTIQSINCPDGGAVLNIALPPDPEFQLTATGMTIAAHVVGSTTSQAAADASALAYLTTIFNGAITQGWIECITNPWTYDLQPSNATWAPTSDGGIATFSDTSFDGFWTYELRGWAGKRFGPYTKATRVYITIDYYIPYPPITTAAGTWDFQYGWVQVADSTVPVGSTFSTQYNRVPADSQTFYGVYFGNPPIGWPPPKFATTTLYGKSWKANIMKEIPAGEVWHFTWNLNYQIQFPTGGSLPESATIEVTEEDIITQNDNLTWPTYSGDTSAVPDDGSGISYDTMIKGDPNLNLTGVAGNHKETKFIVCGNAGSGTPADPEYGTPISPGDPCLCSPGPYQIALDSGAVSAQISNTLGDSYSVNAWASLDEGFFNHLVNYGTSVGISALESWDPIIEYMCGPGLPGPCSCYVSGTYTPSVVTGMWIYAYRLLADEISAAEP